MTSKAQETSPKRLTPKQARFVQEYIVDLNATQAAIRAGYSEDTAHSIGHENLSKPEISTAVQAAMDMRAERTGITVDRVLVELAKLGFADIRQIFTEGGQLRDIASLPDDVAASVQSIEVVTRPGAEVDENGNRTIEYVHKIKLADKKGPLELLGKHLNVFVDRIEHTGKDGGPIETTEVAPEDRAKRIAFALAQGLKAQEKPH
jgi:phage terminase small subunit